VVGLKRAGVLAALVIVGGCSNGEQVTVPNLHHKSVVEAYADLRKLGLKVEIDGPIRVASNHISGVAGHAPEAGEEVQVGSVVTLHPGFRPMGSIFLVEEPDAVRLPNLVGKRLDVAVDRLESLGLLWGTESLSALPVSDEATLLEHYVVTGTKPAPGRLHDQYHRRGNASTFRPLRLSAKLVDD
jgi:beta-lactam-binding protein with PASTA domain